MCTSPCASAVAQGRTQNTARWIGAPRLWPRGLSYMALRELNSRAGSCGSPFVQQFLGIKVVACMPVDFSRVERGSIGSLLARICPQIKPCHLLKPPPQGGFFMRFFIQR